MIGEGLAEIRGSQLTITDAGKPVVRVVAAIFDAYRRPANTQFSKAI